MRELEDPNRKVFRDQLIQSAKKSGKLLICTDFDGTVVNFTGVPSDTELPKSSEDLLNRLAELENLHLAVISGRGFEELTRLVPIENATIAGNHGLKIRFEDGTTRKPEMGEKIRSAVKGLKEEVRGNFGDLEGIIIENKGFGLALHYRQYRGEGKVIRDKFYRIWEDHKIPLLEVIQGAKLLEVRPAMWNKGDAVKLLRKRYGGPPTIYIGDDTTDEDAFAVLNETDSGFPILVTKRKEVNTKARYRLESPEKVHEFLETLYEDFNGISPALEG